MANKPAGVTVLQVFGWVYAAVNAIVGIGLLVERDSLSFQVATGLSESQLLWTAILYFAIAAVAVVATISLGNRADWARWLFAGVAIIQLVTVVWQFFAPVDHMAWSALLGAALPLTTLFLLFGSSNVRAFFDDTPRL